MFVFRHCGHPIPNKIRHDKQFFVHLFLSKALQFVALEYFVPCIIFLSLFSCFVQMASIIPWLQHFLTLLREAFVVSSTISRVRWCTIVVTLFKPLHSH